MLQKFSDSHNYDTWYPQPFQPVIYSDILFPSPRFLTSSRIVINSWTNVGYEFFPRECQRHFTDANVFFSKGCDVGMFSKGQCKNWCPLVFFKDCKIKTKALANVCKEKYTNWNKILSSFRFSSPYLDDHLKSQRKSKAAGTLKAWHLITSWIPSDRSPVVKVMNCPLNCSFTEWQTFLTN